jgi:hypothetical protein
MGLVTKGEARAAAMRARTNSKKVTKVLLEEAASTTETSFDIFLSHSKMDEDLVLGAKQILEEKSYTVYVDWIDDPQLDRSAVSKATAEHLRWRMEQCEVMFYLHSKNASFSKWCPWELGYFDGLSINAPRTFVFPLVNRGEGFDGQEYLKLYPTVDIDNLGKVTEVKEDVWGAFDSKTEPYRKISRILEAI